MIGTKLHLLCPGNKLNSDLHQKIDRKKELLYKDVLPASANDELKREIVQLKAQLQAEVAEVDVKNRNGLATDTPS